MPVPTPGSATSRETSFVMSITDSDGRAAAIEYGTSTRASCPCDLLRQPEVDVLPRDRDFLGRA